MAFALFLLASLLIPVTHAGFTVRVTGQQNSVEEGEGNSFRLSCLVTKTTPNYTILDMSWTFGKNREIIFHYDVLSKIGTKQRQRLKIEHQIEERDNKLTSSITVSNYTARNDKGTYYCRVQGVPDFHEDSFYQNIHTSSGHTSRPTPDTMLFFLPMFLLTTGNVVNCIMA